jgi:hypothetical protein
MTRQEVRALPTVGEPDVLRALQALPGSVTTNDFDAQLYVRGGGPDQNLFVLDGARVFGPYHLFGMNGAFNPDAVERVEFFRGALPARFGGTLSSVVALEQREGTTGRPAFEGGVSLLGARLGARGGLPSSRGGWMVAGRRSHADLVFGAAMPYAFYDAQARGSYALTPRQRVQGAVFLSSDRFGLFGDDAAESLQSRWQNGVGTVQWSLEAPDGWSATTALTVSRYDGSLRAAAPGALAPASNAVRVATARVEGTRGSPGRLLHVGAMLEGGVVTLDGADVPGSFLQGSARGRYALPALYAEAERTLGRVRLAPGVRFMLDARGQGGAPLALEPRLGARVRVTDSVALTLGLARTHQVVSALRDARTIVPGTPFWFVHPAGAPASRGDGLTAELTSPLGLPGGGWQATLGGYARRFVDVPQWRPSGARDLASVSYDDGRALGLEFGLRRDGARASGWLGYGWSRTRLTDAVTGGQYAAVWDRRHTMNAAALLRPTSRLRFSTQVSYGTGNPLWPYVADVVAPRFEPFLGRTDAGRLVPLWGTEQVRLPSYFRVDVGVRTDVRLFGFPIEPYFNLQNLTRRRNVLYYSPRADAFLRDPGGTPVPPGTGTTRLVPTLMPAFPLPTFGIDVRF